MKRDMNLVRELLLKLESLPLRPGGVATIGGHDEELSTEGYTSDQIDYHLSLIREAGFIESPGSVLSTGKITFRRLSWEGHDFLDSVRDPEVWKKTKEGMDEARGFTFDLVKDLAKGLVKKQIEEFTGVKL